MALSGDVDAVNNIYDIGRFSLLTAGLDWRTVDLVVSAWRSPLPSFIATDLNLLAIKARGDIEAAVSLPINGTAATTDGTARTDSIVLPAVPTGADVTYLTMAVKNAVHDQSQLILYIDDALGLPFTPNGLDVVITPDWLQNRGWFRP